MQMELRSMKSDCKGTSFDTPSQLHVGNSSIQGIPYTVKPAIVDTLK